MKALNGPETNAPRQGVVITGSPGTRESSGEVSKLMLAISTALKVVKTPGAEVLITGRHPKTANQGGCYRLIAGGALMPDGQLKRLDPAKVAIT